VVALVMLGRIYRGVWWYQQPGPIRRTAGEFFLANDIDDEKKRAVFLSVIGPTTYKTLRNLGTPAKPANKTLTEWVKVLSTHFKPKL
jgi:hypothetical protein